MSAFCPDCGLITGIWHWDAEHQCWVHDDCDPNWDGSLP